MRTQWSIRTGDGDVPLTAWVYISPAFFLVLAMFHLVPGKVSWHLAVLALVGRLFSVGCVVTRYRKESVTFRTLLGGIIFAALGFTVAALKAVLAH